MSAPLHVRIITPLAILADDRATSLRGVDASGSFGILPGHADFLTRASVSVVRWSTAEGTEQFCALRGGALTVQDNVVTITTREGVRGDDLARLDRDVLSRFRADLDEERVDHVETTRLHLNLMRQMLSRLQPNPQGAGR